MHVFYQQIIASPLDKEPKPDTSKTHHQTQKKDLPQGEALSSKSASRVEQMHSVLSHESCFKNEGDLFI